MTKALVLGAYQSSKSKNAIVLDSIELTRSAQHFDSQLGGQLKSLVSEFGPRKKGDCKIFYKLSSEYPVVTVVGLGPPDAGYNELEDLDEKRENVREGVAWAARALDREHSIDEIQFDGCHEPDAAAEGAHLALWSFDELKSEEKFKKKQFKIDLYNPGENGDDKAKFERGAELARAQNVARRLEELPSNHLTPTMFGDAVIELFKHLPEVGVVVHDEQWARQKGMGAFLSVGRGSVEPSKFLEIHYNNNKLDEQQADDKTISTKPFLLVGKGICFDSGGISLKPRRHMDEMRSDMGGGAAVVATILALAKLRARVHVIGLVPLAENMPSGGATKPGDVVVAMNGKSIQVDNTDAEGRLVLADALCYAQEFEPCAILDVATLTGAVMVALGSAATGVFTNSSQLFASLKAAGSHSGDRVWRLPLYSHHRSQVTDSRLADTANQPKGGREAGACTAAAFLAEFVKCDQWLHLDIGGVTEMIDELPYYGRSMSGRPVRTMFHFLTNYFARTKDTWVLASHESYFMVLNLIEICEYPNKYEDLNKHLIYELLYDWLTSYFIYIDKLLRPCRLTHM